MISIIKTLNAREIRLLMVAQAVLYLITFVKYYIDYVSASHGIIDVHDKPFGRDFAAFFAATQFVKDGSFYGAYNQAAFLDRLAALLGRPEQLFWSYPPVMLFLIWPLQFFDYFHAYALWVAMSLCALYVAMFWRARLEWPWIVIALSCPLVLIALFAGQSSLIVAALIIGGFRLLPRHPVWSGVAFGLLLMKPQFAILVPIVLIALRQKTAFMSAAMTVILLVLITSLCFGGNIWLLFYDSLAVQSQVIAENASKMISITSGLVYLGLPLHQALLIHVLCALGIVYLLCKTFTRRQHEDYSRLLLPFSLATVLCSPYAYPYDTPIIFCAVMLRLTQLKTVRLDSVGTLFWVGFWFLSISSESTYALGLPIAPILLLFAYFIEISHKGHSITLHRASE
jgi:hypothetical protein